WVGGRSARSGFVPSCQSEARPLGEDFSLRCQVNQDFDHLLRRDGQCAPGGGLHHTRISRRGADEVDHAWPKCSLAPKNAGQYRITPCQGLVPVLSWQVTLPRALGWRRDYLAGRSKGFQFEDDSLQLVDERVRFLATEFVQQSAVVPECALALSLETLPDRFANLAIIGKDGAGVMQFVGGGNQADVGVRSSQMLEVIFLTLPPWRFGSEIRIRAAIDHMGHALAKAAADFLEHGSAAAVLDNVVQEGSDGEIFITSGFEHQGRDAQEMRHVGDGFALAALAGVLAGSEQQGALKAWAKFRRRRFVRFHRYLIADQANAITLVFPRGAFVNMRG